MKKFTQASLFCHLILCGFITLFYTQTAEAEDCQNLFEASIASNTLENGVELLHVIFPNAKCERLSSAGASFITFCRWEFGYRSDEAQSSYKRLLGIFEQCYNVDHKDTKNVVNHPDSYQQKLFQREGLTLSLALKDKAALDKTFLFLRIEP